MINSYINKKGREWNIKDRLNDMFKNVKDGNLALTRSTQLQSRYNRKK